MPKPLATKVSLSQSENVWFCWATKRPRAPCWWVPLPSTWARTWKYQHGDRTEWPCPPCRTPRRTACPSGRGSRRTWSCSLVISPAKCQELTIKRPQKVQKSGNVQDEPAPKQKSDLFSDQYGGTLQRHSHHLMGVPRDRVGSAHIIEPTATTPARFSPNQSWLNLAMHARGQISCWGVYKTLPEVCGWVALNLRRIPLDFFPNNKALLIAREPAAGK